MDPFALTTFVEQRFGITLPAPILVTLVGLAIVVFVGAAIEQGLKGWRWLRSEGLRSALSTILRSRAFGVAFSVRFLWRVAVVVWVVLMTVAVWRIGDDMNRYVLPRQLAEEQKEGIAKELKKHKPQDVKFIVHEGDEEAGSYRADLQQALERGGWPVVAISYAPNVRSGLAVNFTYPMEPGKTAEDLARERVRPRRELRPDEALSRALRQAGVQIDGTGSGSGQGITTSTLTIAIGPRRRDRWAIHPPPRFP